MSCNLKQCSQRVVNKAEKRRLQWQTMKGIEWFMRFEWKEFVVDIMLWKNMSSLNRSMINRQSITSGTIVRDKLSVKFYYPMMVMLHRKGLPLLLSVCLGKLWFSIFKLQASFICNPSVSIFPLKKVHQNSWVGWSVGVCV